MVKVHFLLGALFFKGIFHKLVCPRRVQEKDEWDEEIRWNKKAKKMTAAWTWKAFGVA